MMSAQLKANQSNRERGQTLEELRGYLSVGGQDEDMRAGGVRGPIRFYKAHGALFLF